MENGGFIQNKNQRYNYIQLPNFNSKQNKDCNLNKINNNYLSQSQTISNQNKENPLTQSIADKIKEMKEELSKNNSNTKKENNDFRLRLERISKGNFALKNIKDNNNNELKNSKKEIDFKIMRNKIKNFENQREKEKLQKSNALDELDNIFNNFRNNRYGN